MARELRRRGGGPMPVDRSFRASDDDRERVVAILREQMVAGRLAETEFDERVGAAFTARTWDDLRVLVRDLPVTLRFADERPAPLAPAHEARPARPLRAQRLLPIALLCVALILVGERLVALAPPIVFGAVIAVIVFGLGWTRRS